MIERLVGFVFLALLLMGSAAAERLTLGYLELADDPRYRERTAYARIQLRAKSRPFPAAEAALAQARMIGRVIGTEFALERYRGADPEALLAALERWQRQDIRLVLVDLPADTLATIAARTRARDLLLFNVSAPDDRLRRSQCEAHVVHVLPSHAMQMDALVQYLVSRNWRRLLVLQGPLAADAALVQALERASRRFGARVAAVKPFELGNDPRRRERNNIALLTAGPDYDVVVVADSDGEFGRYVPYQTKAARPVVGTTGLVPAAWSWVWERHGAPQVNDSFQRHAQRRMADRDWAAWVAIKAVVQSALRTRSAAFADIAAFLKSDRLRLDGAKGPALSFRSWNNQLRQPMLLATHDAVIARAPVEGFLHPHNTLDTLGEDAGESGCRFPAKTSDR